MMGCELSGERRRDERVRERERGGGLGGLKCFVRRKNLKKNIIESRNNFPTLAAVIAS